MNDDEACVNRSRETRAAEPGTATHSEHSLIAMTTWRNRTDRFEFRSHADREWFTLALRRLCWDLLSHDSLILFIPQECKDSEHREVIWNTSMDTFNLSIIHDTINMINNCFKTIWFYTDTYNSLRDFYLISPVHQQHFHIF